MKMWKSFVQFLRTSTDNFHPQPVGACLVVLIILIVVVGHLAGFWTVPRIPDRFDVMNQKLDEILSRLPEKPK